jgi:hypothetical protein
MHSYSLSAQDDNVVAFEVRPGDVLKNPVTRYADPPTSERSEISMPFNRWANGVAVNVSYEFLVPGGFDLDTAWAVIGQMHADLNTSPPLEFAFRKSFAVNRLLIVSRAGPAAKNGVEKVTAVGEDPIVRDTWHKVRIETLMGSYGYQRVWVNGHQALDLAGAVGFDEQRNWYWRMGLYRRAAATTYRVLFRNFRMSRD